MRNVKRIVVASAVLLFAGFPLGPSVAQSPPPAKDKAAYLAELQKAIAGQEGKPAESVFKNIQLFKGMPAARVLRIMDIAFTGSIGVDCAHCHVPDQWEKDDKEPKLTARKMWGMQSEFNARIQELTGKKNAGVNCYTCHRGQPKPALNPAPSTPTK